MATVAEPSSPSPSGAPDAFAHLLSVFWSIASVQKVMFTHDGRGLDVWVLFRAQSHDDMARAILAERAYRAAVGGSPIDFHFLSLDTVAEQNLPAGTTMFERV